MTISGTRLLGALSAIAAVMAAGCDEPPTFLTPGIGPSDAAPPNADAGTPSTRDAGASDAGTSTPTDYSIVVLPDTQYYAASFPAIFMEQTQWIVEHHEDQQIAFVLHTGDIVDRDDVPMQWKVASTAMHVLDGVVPYVIAAGNHDYTGSFADRMGMANVYFPPLMFASDPWFGGTFEPGHIENSFSLFTVGGMRWVVIALEFGPRDEALAWASAVLTAFNDRSAILITHAFLYHDGSRYDQMGPFQYYNPHSYAMMGQAHSSVNDGQQMWQKLVLPSRNVKLVFSGHDVNGGDLPPGTTSRLASTRPDGSVVYQILANYQTCTNAPCERSYQGSLVDGGNGFLRIVRFSPAAQTISVSTYSPHLDRVLDDPSNRFTLPMN